MEESNKRAPRSRRERGAAAVEFAIIFPLLLLLIGGIVDLGRYMFTKEMLTNAAREGARSIAVGYPEGAWPPAVADATANRRIQVALAGGVTVLPPTFAYSAAAGNCPSLPAATDSVTVTVQTPTSGAGQFKFIILTPASRLIPGGAINAPQLSGTSSMRCGG